MTAVQFPQNPSEGDIFVANGVAYTFSENKWTATAINPAYEDIQGATGATGVEGATGSPAPQGASFIATGTISTGDTVVVNADGTASVITQTQTTVPGASAEVLYNGSTSNYNQVIYDPINERVIVSYRDGGNNNYGTAVVGTVANNTITFGTPYVINSATTDDLVPLWIPSENKIFYIYNQSNNCFMRLATVSGSGVITVSSATAFTSGNFTKLATVWDPSRSLALVAYRNIGGSNAGTIQTVSISGNTLTPNNALVFDSAPSDDFSCMYDTVNSKVILTWAIDSNQGGAGNAVVVTPGITCTLGSTATVSSNLRNMTSVYDPANNKFVTFYKDVNASLNVAKVGTVSGTSISFGASVEFASDEFLRCVSVYDTNTNQAMAIYDTLDPVTSDRTGYVIAGTVSGTSISFDAPVEFTSNNFSNLAAAWDPSNDQMVIAYREDSITFGGVAVVYGDEVGVTTTTNLTSENFIGFASQSVADGESVEVATVGSISPDQTGLTPAQLYYVQTDGSLGLVESDPVVPAGTAISPTSIIIR